MTGTESFSGFPAFDEAVVVRLAREVDDQDFATVFVSQYRRLLIGRVTRIDSALLAEDVDTALDATLSLKVSSATVGTCELADLARSIEGNVRSRDVAGARAVAARLPRAAARADLALAAYLSA